jgi:hypothetical protein
MSESRLNIIREQILPARVSNCNIVLAQRRRDEDKSLSKMDSDKE